MAKFNVFSVAAVLVCFAIVNVAAVYELKDNGGKPCPGCPTDRSYKPVCGDNGKTYDNMSVLKCHSKCLKSEIKVDHFGLCYSDMSKLRIARGCQCAVTADLNPVCGTNGQTYPNKSVLDCDNVCNKSDIKIKHRGNCDQ